MCKIVSSIVNWLVGNYKITPQQGFPIISWSVHSKIVVGTRPSFGRKLLKCVEEIANIVEEIVKRVNKIVKEWMKIDKNTSKIMCQKDQKPTKNL